MRANWKGLLCLGTAAIAMSAGCRAPQRNLDPEFAAVTAAVEQSWGAAAPAAAAAPLVHDLGGPHPVDDYVRYALRENPTIQAARKRVDALANRPVQASSLSDPMLGVTVPLEQVQTAAGQQETLLSASQQLPWPGKLALRGQAADQEVEAARAELAAAELDVIERVKRAYYQLYYVQQAIRITQEDLDLLRNLERIVDMQYRVEQRVTQQDLLQIQVEIATIENQLTRLRQQLDSGQAALAALLHVSPETPLRALDELPEEQIPEDLDRLYEQAIAARPELHAVLARLERDRTQVELARLDYYPDVTLGLTWINTAEAGLSPVANGRDALLLAAGVNLPIYRRRLSAGLREAQAQVVSTARRYDALRDQTLSDVKDLFAQALSQRDMLELFEGQIIPKTDQALQVATRAYQAGDVDYQQLIQNWRDLFRYQLAAERLRADLRQTLASLERVVGAYNVSAVADPQRRPGDASLPCGCPCYEYCPHPAPAPTCYHGCPPPVQRNVEAGFEPAG